MSDEEREKDVSETEEEAASSKAEPEAPGLEATESEGEEATELAETAEDVEEEIEFDLDAQVEAFRQQIEEEPENCVHHYNLGEALAELGEHDEAKAEFELALEYDPEDEFSSLIHYSIGNLYYHQLLSGIQGTVVRSSVGLHSAHKAGDSITQVKEDDYQLPIREFELAIEKLKSLKADEEIVEYVSKNAPQQIADTCYKWASDLIDKSRQIDHYGDEIRDVKDALKHLRKTLEIDPNHSQANLMVKYAKKMLQEGWAAYDEYGFEAKNIQGLG
jgi:tetratricopeptide (TPR) repeat protein